ncbi:hypothetical protein [Mucilaginibacter gilvus]|uniref:Lipoprotein n=1 Tax=Mucilaginibacter gilvus TaxID=2305909 RepID=A0A444MUQ8_9SPHI|nr:hypothetical protein [Mucilaginibacter gilvus]RWY57349.1 hypothetical protein EPL05_02105 [Mucilaginibacter gilvus]
MLKRTPLTFGMIATLVGVLIFTGCKEKTISKADPSETNRVIDSASLSQILALDKQAKGSVFVLTKDYPELKHLQNRVILLPPLSQDLSINFDEYLHKDYMGPINILLPSYYVGIRASVILKCFPGYKGFTFTELSDNYVLYHSDKKR